MSDPRPSVFATLTAPGRGGIAVIRCTGPGVPAALEVCFRPSAGRGALPGAGRLAYGHVLDADGDVLDEIILYREGPETWEVNCHGGPAAVAAVGDRLASLGLEPVDADALLAADAGGPVQREARRLLRSAATPLAARILLDQLNGALARAVREVCAALLAGRTGEAAETLETLRGRWRTCGRYLVRPPRLAVAGRPNVGKSTLLNRLAGRERAITSATPGTTRDYVETLAAFDGLPLLVVDVAGLRETAEGIEREGVARAYEQVAGADLVVYLLDAAEGATAADEDVLPRVVSAGRTPRGGSGRSSRTGTASADAGGAGPRRARGRGAGGGRAERVLAVWNKADLAAGRAPGPPGTMAVSALTGQGLDALRREILRRLDYRAPPPGAAVPFTGRQKEALDRARRSARRGEVEKARRAAADLLGRG